MKKSKKMNARTKSARTSSGILHQSVPECASCATGHCELCTHTDLHPCGCVGPHHADRQVADDKVAEAVTKIGSVQPPVTPQRTRPHSTGGHFGKKPLRASWWMSKLRGPQ